MFFGHAPLTSSTVGLHTGSFAFPNLATYGTRSLVWGEKRAGEKNICLEVGESVTGGIALVYFAFSIWILPLSLDTMSNTKKDNRRKTTPSFKYGERSK